MDAILRPTTPARVLEGHLDLDRARRRCPHDHEELRPDPDFRRPSPGPDDDAIQRLPYYPSADDGEDAIKRLPYYPSADDGVDAVKRLPYYPDRAEPAHPVPFAGPIDAITAARDVSD